MGASTALVKCASTGKGQVLSLNRCWLSLGMKSRTKEMASKTVWIFNVEVDPSNRGQGRAKAALSALVNAADAHGITLKLDAVPLDDVTNKSDLVRLYENMGFKIIGTSVGYAIMHRLPMSETTKKSGTNTKRKESSSLSELSTRLAAAHVQHVLVQATTGDDVFTPYLKLIEAGRKKNLFYPGGIKPSFIKKAIALHPEYGVAKYLELGKHAAAEIEEARSEWKEVFDTAFYKQYKRKPDFADSARVSGVGDDNLPEPVKEKLRELAYRQRDLERVIVLMNTLIRKRDLAKTFLIWAKLAKVFGEKASIRVIVREFKHKNEIELKYDVDEDRIDYNVFENGVLVTDGFIGKDHAPKAVENAVTMLTNTLHDFQKKGK